jgi:hypothetical protein
MGQPGKVVRSCRAAAVPDLPQIPRSLAVVVEHLPAVDHSDPLCQFGLTNYVVSLN